MPHAPCTASRLSPLASRLSPLASRLAPRRASHRASHSPFTLPPVTPRQARTHALTHVRTHSLTYYLITHCLLTAGPLPRHLRSRARRQVVQPAGATCAPTVERRLLDVAHAVARRHPRRLHLWHVSGLGRVLGLAPDAQLCHRRILLISGLRGAQGREVGR